MGRKILTVVCVCVASLILVAFGFRTLMGIKTGRIIKLLDDKSYYVRHSAMTQLTDEYRLLISDLPKVLDNDDVWIRSRAISYLDTFVGPAEKIVPLLIKALGDEQGHVRAEATEALIKFGSKAEMAVPALTDMLKDDYYRSRHAAVKALEAIAVGNPVAVTALIEALVDVKKYKLEKVGDLNSNEYECVLIIDALNQISLTHQISLTQAAVPALIEVLNDNSYQSGSGWYVREKAAEALGLIGDARAVPALIEALNEKREKVRSSVAKALYRIGTPEALEAVN
jgi:HEAT repeat protein